MKYQDTLTRKTFAQLFAMLCLVIATKAFNVIWINNISATQPQRAGQLMTEECNAPRTFPISPLQPVRTHFGDSAHHQILGDEEEWTKLVPGDGTVYMNSPGTEVKLEYTLSIYHQLRCLDIIRRNVVEVERRKSQNPDFVAVTHSTQHCINYLREMVLCRGDLDLETISGQPKSDIILYQYQCWDWDAVRRAVEQNQEDYLKF